MSRGPHLVILLTTSLFTAVQSTPPQAAPSGNLSARAYFKQLYDAGGFLVSSAATTADGKSEIVTSPSDNYVCFNDNASAVGFFTFLALAYDAQFDKLRSKSTDIMMQKNWRQNPDKLREFTEAVDMQEVIQKRAPYVGFLSEDILAVLPSELQAYFRQGRRILNMNLYSKGVKSGTFEFHSTNDSSWTRSSSKGLEETLSIEPTTLRYMDSHTLEGVPPVILYGACEQIPEKSSHR
jgi:hypothetical protein